MLQNKDFELGTWRKTYTGQEFGEISVPLNWTAWWVEDDNPNPSMRFYRPEMKVIANVVPYLDPPRVYSGQQAVQWFGFWKRVKGGLLQNISGLIPGDLYQFSMEVHAWYSQRDDPHRSEYQDAQGNWRLIEDGAEGLEFWLGVDTQALGDPFSPTVAWTGPYRWYDSYGFATLSFQAEVDIATLFVKSEAQYPFKHCDSYIDAASLENVTPVPPPPLPPGTVPYYNRTPYTKRVLVPPQNCSRERWLEIAGLAYDQLSTVSGSADDALGHEPGQHVTGIFYDLTPEQQDAYEEFRDQYYPGAVVAFSGEEPDPPDPPDPDWTPYNYVPRGTKLSFHCIGSYPADRTATLAQNGVILSSIKLLQSIGDFPVTREPFKIGRMIDYGGQNLEGFDYTLGRGTPEQQADARMSQLMPIYAPYKQYGLHLEIINEQDCQSPEQHILLARFFIRAMQTAESNGYKLALFSHSMGTPEPAEWDAIANIGIFEQAAAGGHAISLHEYGDASQGPNSIIGRYRYLYEHIILPKRLDIPLFITEYNVTLDMLGGNIFNQWIAYDNLVRQDPYVAGVHIYTLGVGQYDGYKQAVVNNLTNFVNYAIAQKDIANG